MQLFINNWSSSLELPATASAAQLSVPSADAALLVGLGAGDYYLLTLAQVDANGTEIAWEIVRVTGNTAGVLDVLRGQEGTTALELEAGTVISARLTRATMEELRDNGGPALSDAAPQALGAAAAGTSPDASRADHVHALPTPADIGAATAAQGAAADSAVQPGALATVATTGSYNDLADQPPLGSAAATAATDYATAAQGALADSAVQPGALASVATSGSYIDLTSKPSIPATAAEVGAIAATEKGAASGVATLDAGSKIPLAQLPATAITDTSVVAGEAAMLALTAQAGDVAIRTDISTSFILKAEPASTLTNWQEILAPAAGGGAAVGSDTPQALGSASPGVSASASRQDHVHQMPSAADVGAAPAAHVGAGGTAHADVVAGGASGFMTGAQATKLAGIASGATANSSDATLLDRANHTGTQAISTVTGLQTALDGKAPAFSPVITESTTARTLALTGAGAYIRFTNASASTCTVPPQSSVAWLADTEIHIRRAAAGNLTLTPGAGVTLNAPSGGTLVMTNAMSVTLKRVGTDVWDVIGQTVPA